MLKKFIPPIMVTKPISPDKEKILSAFSKVIDSGWFTNMGEMHEKFEKKLANYLKVKNISVFNTEHLL